VQLQSAIKSAGVSAQLNELKFNKKVMQISSLPFIAPSNIPTPLRNPASEATN
jgi:hypothetical protein